MVVLAAALGRLSSASLVSWRGGTGSWLDQSAWDNGHPAYAQQVQVSGLASIVTLDDAAWTPAVVTLGASASLRAGSNCRLCVGPGCAPPPSSTQEATALVSRCRQLGAVALVGGADERLAARDPAASVARLVTVQCALDCSLLEWRSGRRARARRHA